MEIQAEKRKKLEAELEAANKEAEGKEGEGGDSGRGGRDIGQPRPQSGATNRNPTPRTVRR